MITRFISDTVLFPVPIGENPDDMALFLFGMCLPTFIVAYLFGDIASLQQRRSSGACSRSAHAA